MGAILDKRIEDLVEFQQQLEGGWFDDVDARLHLRLRQQASRLYETARDVDLRTGAVD